MKLNKLGSSAGAVAVLALGVSVMGITPAGAAERTFGSYSCVQGSIYTVGTTTGASTHYVNQGGQTYPRSFPASSAYKTNYYYSGKYAMTSGGVQATGSIQSASRNCAD